MLIDLISVDYLGVKSTSNIIVYNKKAHQSILYLFFDANIKCQLDVVLKSR